MSRLGQIDAVRRTDTEKDTFSLLGEDLELRSRPSGFEALRWSALAATETTTKDEETDLGVKMADQAYRLLEKTLTPESFKRFEEICADNELDLGVVFQTVGLLIGAAAGKAPSKPADSADGQSNTSTSSSSDPGLLGYAEQGLHLVPAEAWAEKYLAS